ncbi:hypothetical protein EON63_08500 [archaeon]|nr:MAG: hypothetical protein EON63_08500 [archaeon]
MVYDVRYIILVQFASYYPPCPYPTAYGVSLLMSEPFYQLLSPSAAKYCRQVDRIRRSALEEPMGLYTYDADMNINWNDPYRYVCVWYLILFVCIQSHTHIHIYALTHT